VWDDLNPTYWCQKNCDDGRKICNRY